MAEDRCEKNQSAIDSPKAGEPTGYNSAASPDRREFLKKTVRRAAYIAPVVLLFKPQEAVAGSGGSAITPGP